jgi:hypothetical protein
MRIRGYCQEARAEMRWKQLREKAEMGIVLTQIVRHLCEDESSGSESEAAEGDHVHGCAASRSFSRARGGSA